MSSVVSLESETKQPSTYCRKEKSLGVLCSNFLRLYDREDVRTIGLDEAATNLGVERRRMYDVVNILEIVGVVSRKAKNQYTWNGLGEISQTLEKLREEGLKENFSASICFTTRAVEDDEYRTLLGLNTGREDNSSEPSKRRNKRDKSLALLTQNFIKLFLCSAVDMILLENAAKALPGDAEDATALRTKVRRLYDIANILSSMGLIEKIRHPSSGKPAYRWLSLGKMLKTETDDTASEVSLSTKRGFGTDITNYNFKRKREVTAVDCTSNREVIRQIKEIDPDHEKDGEEEKSAKTVSKGVVFGPFAPVNLSNVGDKANKRTRQVQDWEKLASTYRPQYRNQALCDLFAHYMEAWKSWFGDTMGSQQMQQTC